MTNASLQEHIRSKKNKDAVRDAMQTLVDLTNIMGSDKDVAAGILEGLQNCHRTLQQSFFRSFVIAMNEYADTDFRDARNDASVEFAKKIKDMDIYFPFV